HFKPRWLSEMEWTEKEESLMAQITATRGFIYERNNQKMYAIADLEDVVTQYPLSCHEVIYDKLVTLLYEDRNLWSKAFTWSGKAMELSRANDNIKKINQETFAASSEYKTYNDYRMMIDSKATLSRRQSMKNQMLRQPMPMGKLHNKDGKVIELSSFLGKTLIIDFWATWCGPCRASFPAMQKLYDKYKNNSKVEFLIVNCWERSDDKKKVVDEFIAKNNYTFPVYFDENDVFAKSLGVTGIPAKFFVSPTGLIQFKESGFQGEAKFIEEGIDKIELLQSDIQ
ncbi:MAG TPA: TlpA disulfide reductase family protein, partial [Candidatus Kapabacteria bacterium]|nr:TlpA disulfide reductase family protein [Candidatus Kapabacteria bacterium]